MRIPWPLGRHGRWQEELDAYVDGELDPRAVERLELHLAGCNGCRETVADRRQVKQLAAALPEMPAPRSFRITPGMLVETPEPARAGKGATVVMRLGQMTAGVAVLALGAVVVLHVGSTSDGQQVADMDGEITTLTSGQESAYDAGSDDDSAAPPSAPEGTQVVPGFSDATVGGAAQGSPEPPGNSDGREQQYATPEPPQQGDSGRTADDLAEIDARGESVGLRAEDDDSSTGFLIAEAALAAVLVIALTAWIMGRRSRSM